MPFRLRELTSDDKLGALLEALHDSYSTPYNGFWQIFKGDSESECRERFLQWHKSDPASHWIYVEDTESGEIVGATQWHVYDKNPYENGNPSLEAYWLKEGTAKRRLAQTALDNFLAGRPHRMNRPHLLVMWCGVRTSYRRRGAGLMMIDWGLRRAERLGYDAFVEATEIGRGMYEAAGFLTVDEFWCDPKAERESLEWMRVKSELELPMRGFFMWKPPHGDFVLGVDSYPWDEGKKEVEERGSRLAC